MIQAVSQFYLSRILCRCRHTVLRVLVEQKWSCSGSKKDNEADSDRVSTRNYSSTLYRTLACPSQKMRRNTSKMSRVDQTLESLWTVLKIDG